MKKLCDKRGLSAEGKKADIKSMWMSKIMKCIMKISYNPMNEYNFT